MLRTCFSTVPSVTHSRRPMPALERPSAIRARTSRSRALSWASGSSRRWAENSSCTRDGSTTEPPLADPLQGLDELVDVGDPALEEVADLVAAGQQLQGVLDLDERRQDEDAGGADARSRMVRAASAPRWSGPAACGCRRSRVRGVARRPVRGAGSRHRPDRRPGSRGARTGWPALPEQHVVVGEDDPSPCGPLRRVHGPPGPRRPTVRACAAPQQPAGVQGVTASRKRNWGLAVTTGGRPRGMLESGGMR